MNEKQELLTPEDRVLVDRLVDGELDEAQQRPLLARLETLPEGWRQCALAFIEAQAWRQEFKSLPEELPGPARSRDDRRNERPVDGDPQPAPSRRTSLSVSPSESKRWYRGPAGTLLGMAASFLIAFGLGMAWRAWDGVDGATIGRNERTGPAEGSIAALEPSPPAPSQVIVPRSDASADTHWATVSLPVQAASGEVGQFEIPVAEGPHIDAQWLRNQPSALSGPLVRELQRRGHSVQLNRQYMPYQLEDGRQVVFPVDQVEVRFVGERIFP